MHVHRGASYIQHLPDKVSLEIADWFKKSTGKQLYRNVVFDIKCVPQIKDRKNETRSMSVQPKTKTNTYFGSGTVQLPSF